MGERKRNHVDMHINPCRREKHILPKRYTAQSTPDIYADRTAYRLHIYGVPSGL